MIPTIEHIIQTEEGGRWYYVTELQTLVPSVTTVLSGIYGKPFPDAAAEYAYLAAERGTEVHAACRLLAGGVKDQELDWDSLDEAVRPRVEGFQRFRELNDWKPLEFESQVVSLHHGYAGTLDQLGYLAGHLSLIDFKPIVAHLAPLQTAGYLLAWREGQGAVWSKGVRRYALHLSPQLPNGFKLKRHEDPGDKEIFLSCLSAFMWGERHLQKGWRR